MSIPSTERAGVIQAIRALKANGWNLEYVDSSDIDLEYVSNEKEAIEAIESVGFATLYVTRAGNTGWVFFTMQNGAPDEVICDYTVNLECIEKLQDTWF